MSKRSLFASTTGIEKAKKTFNRMAWSQEYLAGAVGIETRQPIWKFFTGKAIERHIFLEICFQLGLDWQEIADLPSDIIPETNANEPDDCLDVNVLVTTVRSQHHSKIQAQCGTIQLLDVAQPQEQDRIYVDANILLTITGLRWLDTCDLESFNPELCECFGLSQVRQSEIPAQALVATQPKLMILGKPGSGKTTFLQHIAIQCNQGALQPERIPIFIRLKNFAEDARVVKDFSLFDYIRHELSSSKVTSKQIADLLAHGRTLILLDGLDEVQDEDRAEVLKQIRKFSEQYYSNQFMITCRIAANQYRFEGFTEIEIADFNQTQIEAFAQKWFKVVGSNSQLEGIALATQFIEKLKLQENRQIRELAVTPLLLNLTCIVFQAKADFPAIRSALYKQGLDILLFRWDQAKGNIRVGVDRDWEQCDFVR